MPRTALLSGARMLVLRPTKRFRTALGVAAELAEAQPLVFAATTNRSVVGSMSDICWHVFAGDEDRQIRTEAQLLDMEEFLSGMPHVKLAEPFPDIAVRAILGGTDPKVH
jgi:hypothetical protein